ncbi:MAG: response regulator [Bacteroidales bacterium]|nr:response regulator [Bacteroidales bacterium]
MKTKVLIIEDNEQNMYMLSFLLEQNNYEVFQAFDGEDGIAAAQSIKPDIILLDIQLPGMDGYAVARSLREIEKLKTTPIIAVTSHAMVGDKEMAIQVGANGYVEKPINPDMFIEEMQKIYTNFSMEEL